MLRLLATILAAVAAIAPASAALPHSQEILRATERVAIWQLDHRDDLRHMPAASDSARNPRDWQQATYWVALTELADRSADPRFAGALHTLGRDQAWRLGDRPYHADDQIIGQAWLWLAGHGDGATATGPLIAYYQTLLAHRSTGSLEFTPNPSGRGDPPCTVRWCWCDALFMAPPTLLRLARATGDGRYADFAHAEYAATLAYLYDRRERLFFRDSRFFDRRDESGRKLFWSRGNGWVLAGLVRILGALDADDPHRAGYEHLFRAMAGRIVSLQKADGYWAPSLLAARGSPPESSGTAFFTYALAWGINAHLLHGARYRDAAVRGWDALLHAVRPDGMLGWVQQVSDRPDSVAADDTQFYGAGAFVLAGTAMYDLARREGR